MSILPRRRETAADDYERTHRLAASLGASLISPREGEAPLDRTAFESVISHSLHANVCTEPPAGHTYPKRG